MNYFLSTKTIESSYYELSNLKYDNQSILHIFLILKGIGINNLDFSDVDIIKREGIPYTQDLGGLFSDFEAHPEKCDFINPFMMESWGTNPTEKLKKWVESRIKNNVIGGATTWRKIISQDIEGNFKFVFDYVDQIKNITIGKEKRIPLLAMAIWTNRFTEFESKISINELCESFIQRFNIDNYEKSELFTLDSEIKDIEYSKELYDTQKIRSLIGNPKDLPSWTISNPINDVIEMSNVMLRKYKGGTNVMISKDLLKSILNDYNQLIISGPPGTSKSYLCKELGEEYSKCVHIQFHPQYSYQQFVGGYVVEGTNVKYLPGVMLNLIDEAIQSKEKNDGKKYLVVIDEINRANTSQVFGDLIQCLDRTATVEINCDGKLKEYSIPDNIHIVGTMNSTDRTIGNIDYALKRRFINVYCASEPKLLVDLCPSDNFISISDFLDKINTKIFNAVKNKEMCIGHAIFLNDKYKNADGKYIWDFTKFEMIFNYKILPLVEEYCYGNIEMVTDIVGSELVNRLSGERFEKAIKEFMQE